MRTELVYKAIPTPDPAFFAEMMQMPDPKPEDEEKVLNALPKLHAFFIRKREAYKNRDERAFHRILDEEVRFLQDFEEMALHY